MITAISDRYEGLDDFALCDALSALSGIRLPAAVEEIRTAPVLHDTVVAPEDMPAAVRKFLESEKKVNSNILYKFYCSH